MAAWMLVCCCDLCPPLPLCIHAGALLLEQYQAQLLSAMRTALALSPGATSSVQQQAAASTTMSTTNGSSSGSSSSYAGYVATSKGSTSSVSGSGSGIGSRSSPSGYGASSSSGSGSGSYGASSSSSSGNGHSGGSGSASGVVGASPLQCIAGSSLATLFMHSGLGAGAHCDGAECVIAWRVSSVRRRLFVGCMACMKSRR